MEAEIPPPVEIGGPGAKAKPTAPPPTESDLDEETQRYVTQALTDVDLFSSYGLTQKAIDLLETILGARPAAYADPGTSPGFFGGSGQ